MGWMQLIMAVFGLAKELFKYLREKEENDRDCAAKVKGASDAIKSARKSKDTSKLESAFAELGLASPSSNSGTK